VNAVADIVADSDTTNEDTAVTTDVLANDTFEGAASVTLAAGLAFAAVTWMMKWFYGKSCHRRVIDQRLAPDFLNQMTRRYGIATLIQIAAVAVAFTAPRIGAAMSLLTIAWFLLPQPKPRHFPGQDPDKQEKEEA